MLFSLLACTFSAGHGFGAIAEATLDVGLVPGAARDLGDSTILTDGGYEVAFTELTAELGAIELQELTGGSGGSFDPANPPVGYTLCHGGHCHAEDGSLVDYAEIEAELAGGSASFVTRVSFGLDQSVDLLDRQTLSLGVPDADLGAGELTLLSLGVVSVRFEAEVSKDGLVWPASGTLGAGATTVGISVPLQRGEDPVLVLSMGWNPDGTLLDGLDFATLAVEGELVWDSLDDAGAVDFVAALLANEPVFSMTRSDWSD